MQNVKSATGEESKTKILLSVKVQHEIEQYIKRVQHERKCNIEMVQYEKSPTWKESNIKKVQHEKI